MVKVSVIVPCYNVEDWVERCLNSLVNQTLKDIEIICIDDKSTDDTLKIVKQFAKSDSRIKIIPHEQNMGVSAARNDGLKIAKGEYIGFVDPDDYVATDFYEKLYDKATETGANVISGTAVIIDVSTGSIATLRVKKNDKRIFLFSAFWACIYKKSFLQEFKLSFLNNLSFGEDSVFLANVCLNTQNIVFVEDAFYNYFYRRQGSLDSKNLSDSKAESLCNMCNVMEHLVDNSDLSDEDKSSFIYTYILSNVEYNLEKEVDTELYRRKMFNILVRINKKYNLKNEFMKKFGKTRYKFIKREYYAGFVSYKRHRIYLFGILPFVLVEKFDNKSLYKLFDLIPIIKIR